MELRNLVTWTLVALIMFVHFTSGWIRFRTPFSRRNFLKQTAMERLQNCAGKPEAQCGICGEGPQELQSTTIQRRNYLPVNVTDDTLDVEVAFRVNLLGYIEFRMCQLGPSVADSARDCARSLPLMIGNGVKYYPKMRQRSMKVQLRVPAEVTCDDRCVLQAKYTAGQPSLPLTTDLYFDCAPITIMRTSTATQNVIDTSVLEVNLREDHPTMTDTNLLSEISQKIVVGSDQPVEERRERLIIKNGKITASEIARGTINMDTNNVSGSTNIPGTKIIPTSNMSSSSASVRGINSTLQTVNTSVIHKSQSLINTATNVVSGNVSNIPRMQGGSTMSINAPVPDNVSNNVRLRGTSNIVNNATPGRTSDISDKSNVSTVLNDVSSTIIDGVKDRGTIIVSSDISDTAVLSSTDVSSSASDSVIAHGTMNMKTLTNISESSNVNSENHSLSNLATNIASEGDLFINKTGTIIAIVNTTLETDTSVKSRNAFQIVNETSNGTTENETSTGNETIFYLNGSVIDNEAELNIDKTNASQVGTTQLKLLDGTLSEGKYNQPATQFKTNGAFINETTIDTASLDIFTITANETLGAVDISNAAFTEMFNLTGGIIAKNKNVIGNDGSKVPTTNETLIENDRITRERNIYGNRMYLSNGTYFGNDTMTDIQADIWNDTSIVNKNNTSNKLFLKQEIVKVPNTIIMPPSKPDTNIPVIPAKNVPKTLTTDITLISVNDPKQLTTSYDSTTTTFVSTEPLVMTSTIAPSTSFGKTIKYPLSSGETPFRFPLNTTTKQQMKPDTATATSKNTYPAVGTDTNFIFSAQTIVDGNNSITTDTFQTTTDNYSATGRTIVDRAATWDANTIPVLRIEAPAPEVTKYIYSPPVDTATRSAIDPSIWNWGKNTMSNGGVTQRIVSTTPTEKYMPPGGVTPVSRFSDWITTPISVGSILTNKLVTENITENYFQPVVVTDRPSFSNWDKPTIVRDTTSNIFVPETTTPNHILNGVGTNQFMSAFWRKNFQKGGTDGERTQNQTGGRFAITKGDAATKSVSETINNKRVDIGMDTKTFSVNWDTVTRRDTITDRSEIDKFINTGVATGDIKFPKTVSMRKDKILNTLSPDKSHSFIGKDNMRFDNIGFLTDLDSQVDNFGGIPITKPELEKKIRTASDTTSQDRTTVQDDSLQNANTGRIVTLQGVVIGRDVTKGGNTLVRGVTSQDSPIVSAISTWDGRRGLIVRDSNMQGNNNVRKESSSGNNFIRGVTSEIRTSNSQSNDNMLEVTSQRRDILRKDETSQRNAFNRNATSQGTAFVRDATLQGVNGIFHGNDFVNNQKSQGIDILRDVNSQGMHVIQDATSQSKNGENDINSQGNVSVNRVNSNGNQFVRDIGSQSIKDAAMLGKNIDNAATSQGTDFVININSKGNDFVRDIGSQRMNTVQDAAMLGKYLDNVVTSQGNDFVVNINTQVNDFVRDIGSQRMNIVQDTAMQDKNVDNAVTSQGNDVVINVNSQSNAIVRDDRFQGTPFNKGRMEGSNFGLLNAFDNDVILNDKTSFKKKRGQIADLNTVTDSREISNTGDVGTARETWGTGLLFINNASRTDRRVGTSTDEQFAIKDDKHGDKPVGNILKIGESAEHISSLSKESKMIKGTGIGDKVVDDISINGDANTNRIILTGDGNNNIIDDGTYQTLDVMPPINVPNNMQTNIKAIVGTSQITGTGFGLINIINTDKGVNPRFQFFDPNTMSVSHNKLNSMQPNSKQLPNDMGAIVDSKLLIGSATNWRGSGVIGNKELRNPDKSNEILDQSYNLDQSLGNNLPFTKDPSSSNIQSFDIYGTNSFGWDSTKGIANNKWKSETAGTKGIQQYITNIMGNTAGTNINNLSKSTSFWDINRKSSQDYPTNIITTGSPKIDNLSSFNQWPLNKPKLFLTESVRGNDIRDFDSSTFNTIENSRTPDVMPPIDVRVQDSTKDYIISDKSRVNTLDSSRVPDDMPPIKVNVLNLTTSMLVPGKHHKVDRNKQHILQTIGSLITVLKTNTEQQRNAQRGISTTLRTDSKATTSFREGLLRDRGIGGSGQFRRPNNHKNTASDLLRETSSGKQVHGTSKTLFTVHPTLLQLPKDFMYSGSLGNGINNVNTNTGNSDSRLMHLQGVSAERKWDQLPANMERNGMSDTEPLGTRDEWKWTNNETNENTTGPVMLRGVAQTLIKLPTQTLNTNNMYESLKNTFAEITTGKSNATEFSTYPKQSFIDFNESSINKTYNLPNEEFNITIDRTQPIVAQEVITTAGINTTDSLSQIGRISISNSANQRVIHPTERETSAPFEGTNITLRKFPAERKSFRIQESSPFRPLANTAEAASVNNDGFNSPIIAIAGKYHVGEMRRNSKGQFEPVNADSYISRKRTIPPKRNQIIIDSKHTFANSANIENNGASLFTPVDRTVFESIQKTEENYPNVQMAEFNTRTDGISLNTPAGQITADSAVFINQEDLLNSIRTKFGILLELPKNPSFQDGKTTIQINTTNTSVTADERKGLLGNAQHVKKPMRNNFERLGLGNIHNVNMAIKNTFERQGFGNLNTPDVKVADLNTDKQGLRNIQYLNELMAHQKVIYQKGIPNSEDMNLGSQAMDRGQSLPTLLSEGQTLPKLLSGEQSPSNSMSLRPDPHATVCKTDQRFVCKAIGLFKNVPGMVWWCFSHCKTGACPEEKCKCACETTAATSLTPGLIGDSVRSENVAKIQERKQRLQKVIKLTLNGSEETVVPVGVNSSGSNLGQVVSGLPRNSNEGEVNKSGDNTAMGYGLNLPAP